MIQADYVSVYVIAQQSKKFLMLRRSCLHLKNSWQMVTGTLENNEPCSAGALRELKEETNLQALQFFNADLIEHFYDLRKDNVATSVPFVAFVDEKSQIQLSPTEHDAFEWLSYEACLSVLVFTEQKRILSSIYKRFVLEDAPHYLLIKQAKFRHLQATETPIHT